jgi:hypothetical protein
MNENEFRREIARHMESHVRYGAEVAAALDKIIVTLSGGALVFSMTFADRLTTGRSWLLVLFASWLVFGLSIVSVALSHRALQKQIRKRADQLNQVAKDFEKNLAEGKIPTNIIIDIQRHGKIVVWNNIAIWSFMAAILLLGVFVGRNLLR